MEFFLIAENYCAAYLSSDTVYKLLYRCSSKEVNLAIVDFIPGSISVIDNISMIIFKLSYPDNFAKPQENIEFKDFVEIKIIGLRFYYVDLQEANLQAF